MWSVLCAALALRLLTDLATPFMPGAFMLEESVTAAPSVRAIDEVARPVAPPHVVDAAIVEARPAAGPVRLPDAPACWLPPRLLPPATRHAPDAVEAAPPATLAVV